MYLIMLFFRKFCLFEHLSLKEAKPKTAFQLFVSVRSIEIYQVCIFEVPSSVHRTQCMDVKSI